MELEPERSSSVSDHLGRPAAAAGLAAALLAVIGCLPGDRAGPVEGPVAVDGVETVTVDRVVDGDTLVVAFDGATERVRLIGVDAPESVAPDQPTHCYGPEASHALAELLPEGTAIRVERDVEARDRYDRLLLYVYRADDDLFVNQWLVTQGLAESKSYEPNTAHQATFDLARDEARATGVGLWGHCDGPEQPLP